MGNWIGITNNYIKLSVKDDYNKLFAIIIFVWGVLDTATTYIGIYIYNTTQHESNPFIRLLFEIHPSTFVIIKLVAISIVILAAIYGKRHIRNMFLWKEYLILISILGFLIIARNIFNIIIGLRAHMYL